MKTEKVMNTRIKELIALFEEGLRLAKARKDRDGVGRYTYAIECLKQCLDGN